MRRSFLALTIALFASFSSSVQEKQASAAPLVSTVRMNIENNRVFIDLGFRRPDGSIRTARAWVDTGGGWFAITDKLAEELGLYKKGEQIKSDVEGAVPISAPQVFLGQMPLNLSTANTYAVLGPIHVGVDAEVFLPARVLMHYDAVFDYPARTFTLAAPGALRPRGQVIPTPIDPKSGFARIEIIVGQDRYGLLLDTGASYTMMSREVLDRWATAHPDWSRLTGAAGEANMIGNQLDTEALLLRVPELRIGSLTLGNVGMTSRTAGIFESSMSRLMTAPIVGALAGNVLRGLRVEIDYPHGTTYIEAAEKTDTKGLDSVGIIFHVEADGSYLITGVSRNGSKELVEGVHPGDRLLRIGSLKVTDATMAEVIVALGGKPGERRSLLLDRDGKQIAIETLVQHLL